MPPTPSRLWLTRIPGPRLTASVTNSESEARRQLVDNLAMLFVCFLIGIVLHHSRFVPDGTHTGINAFIISISLPAVILAQVHTVSYHPTMAVAAIMPWVLFAVGTVTFGLLGWALKLPRTTTGALIVMGGLGNTSFIGLPMIEAFYGAEWMPVGIIVDQLGTYLVLSTIGILVICLYAEGVVTRREILRRLLPFPPLIALVVALILIRVPYPAWLTSTLLRLGGTLAPLALVSVGLQLRLGALRGNRSLMAAGLGYKLLLAPAIAALVVLGILNLRGPTANVTLFEAGMAPQIGGSIVAIQYGLDARLITLMVGVGTVVSFATLPGWWYMFH